MFTRQTFHHYPSIGAVFLLHTRWCPWTRPWPLTLVQFFKRSTSLTFIWEAILQMRRRIWLQVRNVLLSYYIHNSLNSNTSFCHISTVFLRLAEWHTSTEPNGVCHVQVSSDICGRSFLPSFPSFPSPLSCLNIWVSLLTDLIVLVKVPVLLGNNHHLTDSVISCE